MNNINDLKDLMRELEEAFYSGNQIPIDCVNYIKEWLRLNDGEGYNTKDWKSECEYYKSECDYLKKDNNFLNLLLDTRTEKYNEYIKITTSFINSLIQTNTLISGQKTYLMYDDMTQKFKIGKSYDPYKREKTLCSDRCSIYLVAYCDYDIESVLHSMYSEYRGRGEWFNLSTNQVRWIIDYFGMKITNQTKLNEFYETANLPF